MPCAVLGRIRLNASGLPVAEYLHRAETLFVEPEWSWVPGRDEAMIFPTVESADEERARLKERAAHAEWYAFAVVCGPTPEAQAARDRREQDRIATSLAGVEASRPAGDETGFIEPRGVAARKVRREADADAALPDGKERWKRVYETRVAGRHVSPAESYENLVRRHLD